MTGTLENNPEPRKDGFHREEAGAFVQKRGDEWWERKGVQLGSHLMCKFKTAGLSKEERS